MIDTLPRMVMCDSHAFLKRYLEDRFIDCDVSMVDLYPHARGALWTPRDQGPVYVTFLDGDKMPIYTDVFSHIEKTSLPGSMEGLLETIEEKWRGELHDTLSDHMVASDDPEQELNELFHDVSGEIRTVLRTILTRVFL